MKSRNGIESPKRSTCEAVQRRRLDSESLGGPIGENLSGSEPDVESDAALTTAPGDRVDSFWSCIEARDWVGARHLLADSATLTWPTSGERFLDADAIIRVNAIYPEGWRLRVVEINPLLDGRVHSVVEVVHGQRRFFANSLFRFTDGLIAEVSEYWASVEEPPPWRTPQAIGAYERARS